MHIQNSSMRFISILILSVFFHSNLFSNEGSSSIYVNLQKLHSLKKVLYVAAHPDDENTRAIAYFSLGEKAETAYFSLTRGDGGQNLIGDDLSENLGVLRTQELLKARSYDRGKQYFSRALDFGYSKSAEESFELWGKDELMHDLVLIIRQFQPDVIITRFPPDERAGHGHHTASALLAIEAFTKASDPQFLPHQVSKFGTWQTTSIYWNTSYWWNENIKDISEDDPNYIVMEIGGYNETLGMSYNEIGTIARSQHKCQGFGAITERGSRTEYFKHLAGEKIERSFFEKKEQTWTSLLDEKFEDQFDALIDNFDFKETEKNVPALLEILKGLQLMPDSFMKNEKIERCKQIIVDCLGLRLELLGKDFAFITNEQFNVNTRLLNRSNQEIILNSIQLSTGETYTYDETIFTNIPLEKEVQSSGKIGIYNPYWLERPFSNLFDVQDSANYCLAEGKPSFEATFNLQIGKHKFSYKVPAIYKWRDPAYGERQRPVIITPQFTCSFEEQLLISKPGKLKKIRVKVHAFDDSLTTKIEVQAPEGWIVKPSIFNVYIEKKQSEKWVELELNSNKGAKSGSLKLLANGEVLSSQKEISYDHIPTQIVFRPSVLKCISLDAKIEQGKVAYIKGVDDVVPNAIAQLGFKIETFEVEDLSDIELSNYNSVVLGIRIYNVNPQLMNFHEKLFNYVHKGGNLIMQYNTASRSIRDNEFGPYPFKLSRKRVTEEDATVTFLYPDHPILNLPNKITKDDFEGWVQERGLYFAGEWDENYTPLFSWSDKGEDPVLGGLIVAQYGKGQFVYTGISFFRELPKGVVGAYRLFANLLSYKP